MRILLLTLVLAGCGGSSSDDPASVSARFIDREFIEVDQAAAIPLTDGPARAVLEHELADVRAVRGAGGTPEQGRGKIYRERVWLSEDREQGTARAIYDLTIDSGRDKDRRHVLVSMRRLPAGWRVTSFSVQEGAAQVPTAPSP
jgi:hypothetical protein